MAKLLGVAEVAEMLSVSADTVRRYVEAGVLPAIRTYGGHMRFRSTDVQAFKRDAKEPEMDGDSADNDGSEGGSHHVAGEPEPDWKRMPPWEQKKAAMEAEMAMNDMMAEREQRRGARIREKEQARERAAEQERLTRLKQYGLTLGVHANQRPQLVRVLERFVTSQQIPAYLSEQEQRRLVSDRLAQFNQAGWDAWRRSLRGE
jgi:excisionase family DNA binding protein